MKIIKEKKTMSIPPYDKHMLDGLTYVDPRSAIAFMRSAISSDVFQRNSPYSIVRKLVKFFDKEEGILRHGRAGSAIIMKAIEADRNVRKAKTYLMVKDSELISLLYEQKIYNGHELVERVSWKLQEIVEQINELYKALSRSGIIERFHEYEGIKGSKDGRQLGLKDLMHRSMLKMSELNDFISRLEHIVSNGKDPLSYI